MSGGWVAEVPGEIFYGWPMKQRAELVEKHDLLLHREIHRDVVIYEGRCPVPVQLAEFLVNA